MFLYSNLFSTTDFKSLLHSGVPTIINDLGLFSLIIGIIVFAYGTISSFQVDLFPCGSLQIS